ncbi:MAG: hypothetical protein DWP97_03425 [Calditrichaeota bacterium]|nr:MAG: hypothetical protein DWP97_03425 [Calditrichota bacterium]
MKKPMAILLAVLMLCTFSILTAGEMWYDMANCEMCKPIAASKGLMENMTWEQHKISNGVLSTCAVKPQYLDAYQKADAAMQANGEKLMAGEKLQLCGSCEALNMIFAKGLKYEKVETQNGGIVLFTSDNAEVVAEVHKWADKNDKEMAKMMEAMGEKDPHAGHNH